MITYGNQDSFYVTLTSNASTKLFSNNVSSQFTNQLQSRIDLDSDTQFPWRVALAEIHIPTTCYNVVEGQNIIYVTQTDKQQFKVKIPPAYYPTIESLLDAMHKVTMYFLYFRYDTQKSSLTVVSPPIVSEVTMSPILCLQLGFEPERNLVKQVRSTRHPQVHIGYPQQIFVYCDIVEHQFLGDTKAPLLHSASIPVLQYGRTQTIICNPLQYLRLAKYNFSTIEIHLRDQAGRNLPFEFGTVNVKLHFARLRTQQS